MKRVIVAGGGIGGLAATALLARAGHEVTLLEASEHLGGKSRRVTLDGQRMDTGPSLVTFPGVWEEFLSRYDALGVESADGEAEEVAALKLRRLDEIGRYYYRGEVCPLPVPEGHPWHGAWRRFAEVHGGLGPEVTRLLTADPLERRTLPALARLLRVYGPRLTSRRYLDGLTWMPDGLREVIAIHSLNAGVAPHRVPALYASMPSIMAEDGVWVPDGGVYEVVRALERLARHAGAGIHTGVPVRGIGAGKVFTENELLQADVIVSNLDADRLEELLDPGTKPPRRKLSCSGVAIYAALDEKLPDGTATHGVVLPSDPDSLYQSLEDNEEPAETMAFVNHYRTGEVYPNEKETLALLLTAPPNEREYDLDDEFVFQETERISQTLGLPKLITQYFGEHLVLHPRYFGDWGSEGGALYGPVRPFWRSGPLHRPRYSDRQRPWLWRVGASVHPGGGIPAVLGGAIISARRLLTWLDDGKNVSGKKAT